MFGFVTAAPARKLLAERLALLLVGRIGEVDGATCSRYASPFGGDIICGHFVLERVMPPFVTCGCGSPAFEHSSCGFSCQFGRKKVKDLKKYRNSSQNRKESFICGKSWSMLSRRTSIGPTSFFHRLDKDNFDGVTSTTHVIFDRRSNTIGWSSYVYC